MKFKIQNSKFKIILILSIVCCLLSIVLCGCEAFRRKFVRKTEKKQKEVKVVVETQDYASLYSLEDVYKQHFSFWRAAQQELIDLLESPDAGRKRRLFFARKTVENLQQMRDVLQPEKQKDLDAFILQQEDLLAELDRNDLSRSQVLKMKSFLKKQKRRVEEEFAFKDIQEYLIKK